MSIFDTDVSPDCWPIIMYHEAMSSCLDAQCSFPPIFGWMKTGNTKKEGIIVVLVNNVGKNVCFLDLLVST